MDWYKTAIEKLGLHEVTCWYSLEKGEWMFNHTDAGHIKSDAPKGRTQEQEKAWRGKRWTKLFCYGDKTRWPMPIGI